MSRSSSDSAGPNDERDRKILVSGIPEGTPETRITIHFQKKKNGGGEVRRVTSLPGGKAWVVFEDPKVAKVVVNTQQIFEETILEVKRLETEGFKENVEKLKNKEGARKKEARTVSVSGLPDGVTENAVHIHFQKKKNGGGEVEKVQMLGEGKAIVVFEVPEVAKNVVATDQYIKGKLVRVELIETETHEDEERSDNPDTSEKESRTVLVSGLPEGATENGVHIHFQKKKNSGGEILSVKLFPEKKEAIVVFEDPEVAKRVAGSKQVFQGKVLGVKLQSSETSPIIEKSGDECTEKARTIVVSDLPEGATESSVCIHFQKKKNGGGEVEKVALLPENTALVVFQDPEVASRIVTTPQQMKGKLLTIGFLNIKESSPEVKTPEVKEVKMTPEMKTASEVKTSPEVTTPEVKAEETATLELVGSSEADRTSEAELKVGKGRQVEERATAAGISLVSIDAMVSTALQYFLSNNVKLFVYQGDLTQEKVDVIVNPANERLEHCHGAAEAISKAGGKIIQSQSNDIMRKRRKDLSAGEVETTAAGRLPCKLIVHAVGPRRSEYDKDSAKKCLYNAVMNSLKIASENGAESISIPAISSGVFGIPVGLCASVLFNAVEDFAKDKRLVNKLQEIRFVNIDKPTTDEFVKEMMKRYSTNIKRETRVDGSLPSTANSSTKTAGKDAERQIAAMNPLMPSPPSNDHGKSKTTDPKASSGDDKCSICLSDFTDKKTLHKCGHSFCSGCIDEAFKHQKKCPVCSQVYGPLIGNQPPGKMTDTAQSMRLPGFESCGTIVIVYTFDGGVQGENHPNPGQRYSATIRRAYLPDNKEGRKVLKLLRKAFDQKLTFTIGRSSTTGSNNVITWNDIHHKTHMKGGPTNFGYPDPDYLKRVQEELAAKGITE